MSRVEASGGAELPPERDRWALFSPLRLGDPEAWARAAGYEWLAGIDEAGRGALAGPVAAACVVLPPDHRIQGLNDSKQIPPGLREQLAVEIRARARAFAVAFVSPDRVDALNVLEATREAMLEALTAVAAKTAIDLVLVDGNQRIATRLPQRTLVHGDALSENIAAASILAKVERDQVMARCHELYPVYGFARHKGYGTEEHLRALREHGPCPIHRRTFRGVSPP
jgi:ribonuclease HII